MKFVVKASAYAAIEARYHCEHHSRNLRKRIIADGRVAYYRQCIRCGYAGNAVSAKIAKQEGGVGAFDPDLEHYWRAQKHAEYLVTYERIVPELRQEYRRYLESKEWEVRRVSILARAKERCEICEYFPPAQIHHVSYTNIGNESEDGLLAVCGFCHGLLHNKTDA